MTTILTIIIAALALTASKTIHIRRTRERSPLQDILKLAKLEQKGWKTRLERLIASRPVALNVMTSEDWKELITPGLRKIFHLRMRKYEDLFKGAQIFPQDTSDRAFEDYQGIGELGTDMWNQFEKTGRTTRDDFEPGWKTRLEHREFTGGVNIRRKLVDDNLYPTSGIPNSLSQRVEKLASSAAVHREKSAAALFNLAFTDTGVDAEGFPVAGADGVGLCSTVHKATPTNPATQSNEGTSALTGPNLAATRLLMRKFTDDKGNPVSISPTGLLIPPELEDTAAVILKTDEKPGGNDNDVNVNKNRFNPVVWDYLTSPAAWFLIDDVLKDDHLTWLDRVKPEFTSDKDVDTQIMSWTGYYRFSRGFDAWQWIFGQNP